MAKKVVTYIKLQVPAGKANPSPPVGPALGQHTRTAISRAESFAQGITLFLVAPEFQRR